MEQRTHETKDVVTAKRAVPTFAGFVETTFWPWAEQCWKPSTRDSARSYLKTQLLPAFGHCRLNRLTVRRVSRWFDHCSTRHPGGANRALSVLTSICKLAEQQGYITDNPTRGIRKNPTRRITRFMDSAELQRLEAVLSNYARGGRRQKQAVAIIRLLLLTGCRHREIIRLRWQDIRKGRLYLPDSKTGPREVLLGEAALKIIRRLPVVKGGWVFPNIKGTGPQKDVKGAWLTIRKRAGLEDVRLHDLRHTFASEAARQGYPLPVIARLLGHGRVESSLRYTHGTDQAAIEGVQAIGEQLDELLGWAESTAVPNEALDTLPVDIPY